MRHFAVCLLLFLTLSIIKAEGKIGLDGMKFVEKSIIKHASSKWIIRYIIAIDEFMRHSDKLGKYKQKIFKICERLKNEPNCNYYRQFIQTNEKHMRREFENLKSMTGRSKSAITLTTLILSLVSRLFASNSDQNVIDELQKTDKENRILVKDHISIMNSTMVINKQAFDKINQRISMLNEDMLKLASIESEAVLRMHLSNIIQISNLIMLDFYAAVSTFLKIINHESPLNILDLIGDDIFYSNLQNITDKLGEGETLPFEISNATLLDFIRVSDLSVTMSIDHFYVEIGIPILNSISYVLYKILLLPFQARGSMNMFDEVAENILINPDNFSYVLVPNYDLQLCRAINQSALICPIRSSTYTGSGCEIDAFRFNNTRNCSMKKIPTRNYVIRVDKHVFYIVPVVPIQTHIECTNGTRNTLYVNSTCEIFVDEECTFWNDDFEYSVETEKSNNVTIRFWQNFTYDFEPDTEFTVTALSNNTILLEEFNSDFKNVTQQLLELYQQANKLPEKITVTSNEQQLVTLLLWALVLFVVIRIGRSILHVGKK